MANKFIKQYDITPKSWTKQNAQYSKQEGGFDIINNGNKQIIRDNVPRYKYNTTIRAKKDLNINGNIVKAGQRFKIVKNNDGQIAVQTNVNTVHIVKPGQTASQIAKQYNVPLNNLGLDNPNLILVGQKIPIKSTKTSQYTTPQRTVKDTKLNEQRLNETLSDKDLINHYYKTHPSDTPYIIDDKKNGKLLVYKNGVLLDSFNAAHGVSGRMYSGEERKFPEAANYKADDYTITHLYQSGPKKGKLIDGAGNLSTPAGIFYTTKTDKLYHGAPSFIRRDAKMVADNNPNGIASSIHTGRADGARSNGCTRLSSQDLFKLDKYIGKYKNVPTYILLDNEENGDFFIRNDNINFKPSEKYKKDREKRKEKPNMQISGVHKGYVQPLGIELKSTENLSSEQIQNAKSFANTLHNIKKQIIRDFGINDDTYNDLAAAALGIYGRETSFGKQHSFIGNLSRGFGKLMGKSSSPDYKRKYEYGPHGDFNSIGHTQIRLGYVSDKVKQFMKDNNITRDDLVYDVNKAAMVTIAKLADEYMNQGTSREKAIRSWNFNQPNYVKSVDDLSTKYFNFILGDVEDNVLPNAKRDYSTAVTTPIYPTPLSQHIIGFR